MVQASSSAADASTGTSSLVPDMFRIARRLRSAAGPRHLDVAALLMLHRLAADGAKRPSELAGDVTLDLSTVSRHIRALEEARLVTRQDDPVDGRSCLVSLTADGQAMLASALIRREQVVAEALVGWDAEDVADLLRLIARLADDLDRTPEESS